MDTASSTPTTDAPVTISDAPAPVVVQTSTPSKAGWGGLIGIILIVGLIITAAFYSWGERLASQPAVVEKVAE